MLHIQRFIDKVTQQEQRMGKDLVLNMQDARLLRDDIARLLCQRVEQLIAQPDVTEVIVKGGNWSSDKNKL
jgi:hypothetical protein